MSEKPTNPKDMVGVRKAPLSSLPIRVLWRVGLAMLEGALKYGRHNYRGAGVRASVYFDAACRHLFCWWEGEDEDPDTCELDAAGRPIPGTGLSHLDKLLACLMVLRDAMLGGKWEDDRPPCALEDMAALHGRAGALIDRYGDRKPKHWTIADSAGITHE